MWKQAGLLPNSLNRSDQLFTLRARIAIRPATQVGAGVIELAAGKRCRCRRCCYGMLQTQLAKFETAFGILAHSGLAGQPRRKKLCSCASVMP